MDNSTETPTIQNEPTEPKPVDEVNNTEPTSLEPAKEEKTKPKFGITLIAVGIGLVLIGIVAYLVIDGKYNTEVADVAPRELAANLISEKYGDKCVFARHVEGDDVTVEEIYVKCEALGDKEVLVRITDLSDATKREISDNYVATKYAKDVEKTIADALEPVYGATKVLVVEDIKLSSDNKDDTLEEYLADENHVIEVKVFATKEGTASNLLFRAAEALQKKLTLYKIAIYQIENDDIELEAQELSNKYTDRYAEIVRTDIKESVEMRYITSENK